ncbi:serpentine type 7TM GPCR chemoreceptor str domain-containing protein [Ditylenchus destructor]|nr:serpentine type 7TM GPCR chemoreceptor str domain-containing protein [Ditylenchus destructor]
MTLLLVNAGYPNKGNDLFQNDSLLFDRLRESSTDDIPLSLNATPTSFKFVLAFGVIFVGNIVCYGAIVWCSFRILRSVNKAFKGMADNNRLKDVNKQLTYTLIAQASLPALMLGLVSFAVGFSLFFMEDPSSIYSFVYITVPLSWLPVLSPILTICLVRSYRNFFGRQLFKGKTVIQTPVTTIYKSGQVVYVK